MPNPLIGTTPNAQRLLLLNSQSYTRLSGVIRDRIYSISDLVVCYLAHCEVASFGLRALGAASSQLA